MSLSGFRFRKSKWLLRFCINTCIFQPRLMSKDCNFHIFHKKKKTPRFSLPILTCYLHSGRFQRYKEDLKIKLLIRIYILVSPPLDLESSECFYGKIARNLSIAQRILPATPNTQVKWGCLFPQN